MAKIQTQSMSGQIVAVMALIALVFVSGCSQKQTSNTTTNATGNGSFNNTVVQINPVVDNSPRACYSITSNTPGSEGIPTPAGCTKTAMMCQAKLNEADCLAIKACSNTAIQYVACSSFNTVSCCKWARVSQ